MSALRAPPRRLPRRSHFAKVTRWFPGRGSAFVAPPVQVFYSSKLRARLLWWKQEKAPRRVLQALQKGVDLEFEAGPPAPFSSAPILVSEKDVDFVVKDLEKGDRLGAYTPLVPGGEDYLSRARVDTRPNGKQRLVLNFRRINAACRKLRCRFEQLRDLPNILRRGDYMLSMDLAAAFWHVPMAKTSQRFVSWHLALPPSLQALPPGAYWVVDEAGRRLHAVVERSCAALPFGWTSSPFIWTKVVKVLARAMRSRGMRCLWFLDDALIALPSKAAAHAARDLIEELLANSGLTRAPDKGIWEPTRTLPDHLGFEISTSGSHGHIKVPPRRALEVAALAKDLLCRATRDARRVSTDILCTFIGKASSLTDGCDLARFHLRSLHDAHDRWAFKSRLDRAATRDLRWWAAFSYTSASNGVPLWPLTPSRAIYTDASSTIGYGCVLEDVRSAPKAALKSTGYMFEYPSLPGNFATAAAGGGSCAGKNAPGLGGKGFGGYWSKTERELLHITHKELRAVIKGIRMNADALRGHVVRLWEDNMAVVHIIRAKTSRSAVLMAELRDLLDLLRELDIILLPKYIRSQLNPSDYFSRLTDRDAWMLRPRLRASLRRHAENVLQEPISLDAFACHQTAIVPRYASRHSEPAALAHDGLALDWTAEQGAVWICPPFALLPAIIQKLEDEKPAAVLIAPKWQMASWWPNLMRLGGLHVPLPRSKHAVISLHGHKVEPFLNGNVELIAVLLSRTR